MPSTDFRPSSPRSEEHTSELQSLPTRRSSDLNVVAVDVRTPGDDVARMRELFGLGAELDAEHRLQALFARRGTDAALQLRGPEAVEETAVHGSAVEGSQCASVREGQDGFGAVVGNDPAKAMGNFVERLVPGKALP